MNEPLWLIRLQKLMVLGEKLEPENSDDLLDNCVSLVLTTLDYLGL